MKKCKLCKELNVREFNGIAISKYCVACRKAKAQEKKEKHLKTKGAQESLRKKLHKKAWGLISEFVRKSAAKLTNSSRDVLRCYTCGKLVYWKKAHCSHFHHNRLDFDLRNLKACCAGCNTYKHGNLAIYASKLVMELTMDGMGKLYLDANIKGNNYSIEELENIIEVYKQKLKELEN